MWICGCEKQDLAVVINAFCDANNPKYTVSIACATCHRPVFIELGAWVESEDIPMRLNRKLENGEFNYKLKLEPER